MFLVWIILSNNLLIPHNHHHHHHHQLYWTNDVWKGFHKKMNIVEDDQKYGSRSKKEKKTRIRLSVYLVLLIKMKIKTFARWSLWCPLFSVQVSTVEESRVIKREWVWLLVFILLIQSFWNWLYQKLESPEFINFLLFILSLYVVPVTVWTSLKNSLDSAMWVWRFTPKSNYRLFLVSWNLKSRIKWITIFRSEGCIFLKIGQFLKHSLMSIH